MRKITKSFAALLIAAVMLSTPLTATAADKVDAKAIKEQYPALSAEQLSKAKEGDHIAITGKMDYKSNLVKDKITYPHIVAENGTWAIALGDMDLAKLQEAAKQDAVVTIYGTIAKQVEKQNVIDLMGGYILISETYTESAAFAPAKPAGNAGKAGTSAAGKTASAAAAVASAAEPQGTGVWIPTKGGKKYHSKATCSGMENPQEVTVEKAVQMGFTPCGRCCK